jgi:hypothetical protein
MEGMMRLLRGLATACLPVLMLMATLAICAAPARSLADQVDVIFDFIPAKASYAPNESFEIAFTVRSVLISVPPYHNEIKVTNLSAQFTWMGPGEWTKESVSSESVWLYPDEFGIYKMNLTVPANATAQNYGYMLKVEFQWMNAYGVIDSEWTSPTFHDFAVAPVNVIPPPDHEKFDYAPYIGVMALVLAIGSIGALMYHRRSDQNQKDQAPVASDVGAMGVAEVPTAATYPVIHAAAGEHFPIERGFIYLVKEKRPNIAFAVFNEAVSHGAKGMLVVREHPNRLRQTHSFDATKILWLTRRVGVDHIDPTELSLLSLEITKFVGTAQKSVVLLEGIEYIITQNDFESVLRFVNHLHDFVLAHDSAVIIVIDPRVLSTRELALLERSGRVVEPAEVPNGKIDKLADELEA